MKQFCLGLMLLATLLAGAMDKSWKFSGMSYRTRLDWNPTEGCDCELELDFELLSHLNGDNPIPVQADSIGITALTPAGETVVPLSVTGICKNLLRIRFVLPDNATGAMLYFGGKNSEQGGTVPSGNLLPGALDPKGWKAVKGTCTFDSSQEGLVLRAPASADVRKDFTLPDNLTPGSPIVLDFSLRSLSGLPWNISFWVRQLDANGKELPSCATDPRWSAQYIPIDAIANNQVFGHLDPRAKKIRLVIKNNVHPNKFDPYGKPLAPGRGDLHGVLTKLEVRTAQKIYFPGPSSEFFTEGVDGGRAFRLNGKHAPFYNGNPPCVWSEGMKKLTAQEDYHWSKGDGTFEAWVKFDKKSLRQDDTILEVYQDIRKSLMKLNYRANKKQLEFYVLDFGGKSKTLSAPVELKAGEWFHVAGCWSQTSGIALFLNGKQLVSDPNFKFQVADLEHADRCDSIMPDNISMGVPAMPIRNLVTTNKTFMQGAIDKVRFSTVARYTGDFVPSKDPKCDEQTCAFFDYENTYDGIHGTGDQFIAGSVFALDSPWENLLTVESRQGEAKTALAYPENIVPENHPFQTLPATSYPTMPTAADFQVGREKRLSSFNVRDGEKIQLNITEPVHMDYLEIACPEHGSPVDGPTLLNQGDIDIRSYGDVRDSMFPTDGRSLSDHQRAIKLFSFLIQASDYYMTHPPRIDGRAVSEAQYSGMSMLASYCCFDCGPLNNLTMDMFAFVLGFNTCMTGGNGHTFEQVFYDGRWHVYDLSAESYFPSRRQNDAASLDEIEQDPMILGRIKFLNASHFYRLCARNVFLGALWVGERQSYVLNPGETIRVYWHNNGVQNDLLRKIPRIARMLNNVGRDVTSELDVQVASDETILQIDRPYPHYSTGFLRFDGNVSANNPAFTKVTGDSFTYRFKMPYPALAATYKAEGTGITYELSYDQGATWRKIPTDSDGSCRLKLEVRARHQYLLRVTGKLTGKFQAEVNLQLNSRVLAGALHQGENEILFKTDAPANAKVTYAYRVDTDRKLELGNVLSWGVIPGEEKQMIPLNPEEPWEITASGLGKDAELRVTSGIEVKRYDDKIKLTATDPTARLGGLLIRDGKTERRLVVAVLPGSRWIPLEKMKADSGMELLGPDATRTMPVYKSNKDNFEITYSFAPIPAGKYMLFHIARNPLKVPVESTKYNPGARGEGAIMLRHIENGKDGTVLVRKVNRSAEFLKAEKTLWRFRWDYPITGKYAFEYMNPLSLPDCSSLKVRCLCPDFELAGALLIPANDMNFMSDFRKYCCGFNYQPLEFLADSDFGSASK